MVEMMIFGIGQKLGIKIKYLRWRIFKKLKKRINHTVIIILQCDLLVLNFIKEEKNFDTNTIRGNQLTILDGEYDL